MFAASAELYDLIYSQFKDYAAEADALAALIRARHPGARTVLDVACGTAEHARLLTERHGFEVDGLDLEPAFVEISRRKLPGAHVHLADMTDFSLGARYDVVMCLFSSIAYARTAERITAALRCFRAHLADGGIVLVEPWFAPGVLEPGRTSINTAEGDGVRVCRMSHMAVDGRISQLRFDYLIGTAAGIEHASELHELGLLTTEEMMDCFRAAGLAAEHDLTGPSGRGLFMARAEQGR